MPLHDPNTVVAVTSPHLVVIALAAFVVALLALYIAHNSRR